MIHSRTEKHKRTRAKRRRNLYALNIVLLAAICGVGAWNIWSTAAKDRQEPPAVSTGGERAETATSVGQPPEPGDGQPEEAKPANGQEEQPGAATEPTAGEDREDSVSLAIVGDVLLGEYVGVLMKREGYHYPYVHVQDILQQADIAAANLETAVTAGDGEKPGVKTYEFRSDPAALPALREAGFDMVSLANNHTLDFGPEGLRDTMKHLRENGIAYAGAGETADEAYAPVIMEKNGVKVALFSFGRVIPDVSWKVGTNKLGLAEAYDYSRPVQEIEAAKQTADVVVVMVHWGEEGTTDLEPVEQIELGRRFVDAGADLVVGSHPHLLQGIEHYNGKWIAYSMGNFVFTKSRDERTYDTGILLAECGKKAGCKLRLVPLRADTPQPKPMTAEQSEKLFARLNELSVRAAVDHGGNITPKED